MKPNGQCRMRRNPASIKRLIDSDLRGAMEGFSEERRVMVRTRAAWNAHKFVMA